MTKFTIISLFLVFTLQAFTEESATIQQLKQQIEELQAENSLLKNRLQETSSSNLSATQLPYTPLLTDELVRLIKSPEQIDAITENLGVSPRLMNFHLATVIDNSDIGLGQSVHIPVQISSRKGGRTSLLFLKPGEEVLAGIYVTNKGMALRYVKKLTGEDIAKTGDTYLEKITTRGGRLISQEEQKIEIITPNKALFIGKRWKICLLRSLIIIYPR